jgi:propanediol dehydratase large subunit
MAMTKLRARRTPSNQAHVTNRLDDPLLLAADAATAAAYGFREIETTVPVLADAPSNAVAVTVGAAVASAGILVQCSVEEAMELEMGIRGLVSYAETVSLYGTESVFVDGDDTPYSKAILAAGYASRGVKMRVSSGAGAEVLMGGAEQRSMLYLESRCVSLARAIGVQGVQNGGIDGASVARVGPQGRARADGGERHGDGAQPRGLHRQRRADVGVRRPSYVQNPADPAGRQRLRVQRLRLDPALRQHVRALAVERRGHRRLAGHAA